MTIQFCNNYLVFRKIYHRDFVHFHIGCNNSGFYLEGEQAAVSVEMVKGEVGEVEEEKAVAVKVEAVNLVVGWAEEAERKVVGHVVVVNSAEEQ